MLNELIRKAASESGLDVYGLGKDKAKWDATLQRFSEALIKARVEATNKKWEDRIASLEEAEAFERKRNYHYTNTNSRIDFPVRKRMTEDKCWCHTCNPISALDPSTMYMRLCPDCGNKRCPKATDHRLECTNSNEPNQEGSIY